ncbi:MAG: SoxR reducing system RseC family protein [Rikenellaceae bacterium]
MATKDICHSARVIWVEGSRVGLTFESRTGCSGCQAKHKCGMSGAAEAESTRHDIEVEDRAGVGYKVGDDVTLSITMEMGAMAVVLAYVVPLFVMLTLMIIAGLAGLGDLWVALAGVAGVAFYYIFLYFFRGKLKKRVNFTINK